MPLTTGFLGCSVALKAGNNLALEKLDSMLRAFMNNYVSPFGKFRSLSDFSLLRSFLGISEP
jgi:hypothetical protein